MKALVPTIDQKTERVYLVALHRKPYSATMVRESLEELGELALTAGARVIGSTTQKLPAPVASSYIGRGKATEIALTCQSEEVDTVIFDEELSPAQARNLEKLCDCKILDRTSLILDIFAQRARTREGKLQVELAQLQHLLPRLTRYWTHLSRQKGGIGMRGDGESQLETDRRKIGERIDRLTRDLNLVRRRRTTQRQGRQRHLWPLASIVGYTNAGKSTLLNALTNADTMVEDKLFATLDPTTRRLRLPTNQNVMLTDTVGFIRKLPHDLVEAFKATLEEVQESDLLIHVVDASQPNRDQHIEAVNRVLKEIGADEKPTLMILNKVDQLDDRGQIQTLLSGATPAVAVSARTREGFEELFAALNECLRPIRDHLELAIPHEESQIIARLHANAQIMESDYRGKLARFKARVPPRLRSEFKAFIIREL